jgi:hypothetical protein
VLWHFHCSSTERVGCPFNPTATVPYVAMTDVDMLQALTAAQVRTLSDAVPALLNRASANPDNSAQEAAAVKFGAILSDQRVASHFFRPNPLDTTLATSTKLNPPDLQWDTNGQSGYSPLGELDFHLNHHAIEFWNDSLTQRLACRETSPARPGCSTGDDVALGNGRMPFFEWAPAASVWTTIADSLCTDVAAGSATTVLVVLMNSSVAEPVTGPYIGQPVGLTLTC